MNCMCEYMIDDQCFVSCCLDVMVYELDILEEDVMFIGLIIVKLFVFIIGIDVDYVVKLIDVFLDLMFNYMFNEKSVFMGGY